MSANALLLWMSARREGSWAQFRAAVEELRVGSTDEDGGEEDDTPDQLELQLYQTLRFNLQRLGHVEFFAGAGGCDWRVTPPSLAVTSHPRGWLGVLVGARSLALLHRFIAAAEPVKVETLSVPTYPDQIIVRAPDRETLAAMAERAGLCLQSDAPAALLSSLPAIDDALVRHSVPLPIGTEWRVDRFSAGRLTWRAATLQQAAAVSSGLFRFSFQHQRSVLFCERGKASRIPGQVGKYLVLRSRRCSILRYDARGCTLAVPASCRPPFLIERALILCSGSPPAHEGSSRAGVLRYNEIPENIAESAAALLRQELR